jgi:aspartate kinase
LGEAIGAISVEIYSDVDGIMTADPKIVPNASVLSQISYSDILELASKGAKVIHPRAIEYAIRGNMPVFIKSTYKCTPGTLISLGQERSFGMDKKLPKQVITGIAHITDRVQITIYEDDPIINNHLLTQLAGNTLREYFHGDKGVDMARKGIELSVSPYDEPRLDVPAFYRKSAIQIYLNWLVRVLRLSIRVPLNML